MDLRSFIQKVDQMIDQKKHLERPLKVVLKSGDIVDIEDVKLFAFNGGEVHIIAGPTYDETLDEEDGNTVVETRKA